MEKEITLKLTEKNLDIIANALGNRPYLEVAQLIQDIGRQVQAQQDAKNTNFDQNNR